MKNLMNSVKSFFQDESGVTAIEYGLIAALIAVVIVASVAIVGTQLNLVFKNIGDCLKDTSTC